MLMMNVINIWMDFYVVLVKILLYATRREFITHKQRTTNWCHSHGLPSNRGGLHPPIWSTGRSSRPDTDQIQDLNRF